MRKIIKYSLITFLLLLSWSLGGFKADITAIFSFVVIQFYFWLIFKGTENCLTWAVEHLQDENENNNVLENDKNDLKNELMFTFNDYKK